MRGTTPSTTVLSVTALLMLLSHGGESSAQPILAYGTDADITDDGLHRVNPDIMAAAWIRPGVDLSSYDRMFLMPATVQFRELPRRRFSTTRSMEKTTEFPVSPAEQARLGEMFGEAFRESIEHVNTYELTDELGRDVLMVQGHLADVISGVPPDLPGSVLSTIAWAWEANIVLELRDSMSGEVLARTIERQRMDGPVFPGVVWALTPRVVNGWSQLLIKNLYDFSNLQTTRPGPF